MRRLLAASGWILLGAPVAANAVEFAPIDQACEEALALSALPASMRDRANVYVWQDDDYVKTMTSDGGFHCLVQRNHAQAIIPECISSTGEESILRGIIARAKMVAAGVPDNEAHERVKALIESGDINGPSAPGVNFMMSAYNRIYAPEGDRINPIPPHSMFFAPNAEAAVIGGSFPEAIETKGFPFVVEDGLHSYIVTMTDKPSDSADVVSACRGQIDVDSPFHQEAAKAGS